MTYGKTSHTPTADIPVTVFTAVLTSAAVTVAILYFTGNLLSGAAESDSEPEPEKNEKTIETPSLKGLSPEVAGSVLRSRGLRLVVQEERPDPNVPKGKIADQDPLASSELVEGGSVAVVVSSGPGESPVPDVSQKPLDEAKRVIAEAGFKVGKVTESATGTIPGAVVETDPTAGSAAKPGSTVNLVVTQSITVPDVVGMFRGRAQKTITEAGLKLGKVKWGDSEYRDGGAILAQEPEAGAVVVPGTEIVLTVNTD